MSEPGFVFDDDLEKASIPSGDDKYYLDLSKLDYPPLADEKWLAEQRANEIPDRESQRESRNLDPVLGSRPLENGGRGERHSEIPPLGESHKGMSFTRSADGHSSEPGFRLVFRPAREFADVEEPDAETVLGGGDDEDDAALVAGGIAMFFGKGGAGKTILTVDLGWHLAAGADWIGLSVPRPHVVAIVEQDGPRGRFRKTVKRKRDNWTGPDIGDRLDVLEEPWAELRLSEPAHREELARYLNGRGADVLIAGPVVTLGMIGGGTPDEVATFEGHVRELRKLLERPLLLILIHHTNKRDQISGAWDRVPDTLIGVVSTGTGTRVIWEKARNSSALHKASWKLRWTDGLGFELDDTPDKTEEEIDEALLAAAASVPGAEWKDLAPLVPKVRAAEKLASRKRLIDDGRLVNVGKGRALSLYRAEDVPDEQTTLDDEEVDE